MTNTKTIKNITVAKVLDGDYKLVLNVGKNDGVALGDKFIVYSLSKEDIIDPSTRESLGKLEIVKGRGEVTHVQEKMCIIDSIEKKSNTTKTINITGFPTSTVSYNDVPFSDPLVGDYAKKIN